MMLTSVYVVMWKNDAGDTYPIGVYTSLEDAKHHREKCINAIKDSQLQEEFKKLFSEEYCEYYIEPSVLHS